MEIPRVGSGHRFARGDRRTRVYATTELGGMYCLNAKTGKQIWWAPEVLHFVAAGKQRVYAADKLGRLRILDARNGAMLDSLPTSAMPIKISNGQTDRIYLATEGGIIQCLREVEQVNPVVYNESRKPPPDEDQPKSAAESRSPRAATAVRRRRRTIVLPRRSPRPRSRRPRRTMPPARRCRSGADKPANGQRQGRRQGQGWPRARRTPMPTPARRHQPLWRR